MNQPTSLAIVELLKQRGSLPTGFVAKVLERSPGDLREALDDLKAKAIVVEDQGTLHLAGPDARKE